MEMASSYTPENFEQKWNDIWEKENLYHAEPSDNKEAYSIVIPPPNVTGSLHMGHALNNTLQDILIRWQRMSGKSVLWMPGMDHAGIATQNVVEKLLAKEGKSKNDLGREAFQEKVWEWKAHSGGQIKAQLKRLGASCDWERERFTLDEGLSKAVRKVFVSLYKEGLIYQGHRIINWCPRCVTALSDIETDYKDVDGRLYHFKYPFADKSGFIIIATTRPESMLGDTAVACNPNDDRYMSVIGKTVLLPLMDREIPIIADDYVDMEFGTGLVKITPAHDPNDYEVGKRHNLPEINVLTETGVINENGGKYKGLDRYAARKQILADLESMGLVDKIDEHKHSVGHCYRCSTVIEPYYSKQWFVKIKPLADEAITAVTDGSIRFVPQNWEKTYFEWMNNIKDWCISRQLWWGHRIPVFYCNCCGHVIVEMDDPSTCTECGSKDLVQDPDVLDTWFSSALWPFSTMGWPDKTAELDKYYPTSVLVTGFDIIFFWVARMIMMGLKFMKTVPFRDVYIHALVRDEHGQKMSKSKGNVIDPLIIMDNYGTDAFRFTLAIFAAQGRDIIMSEKRIEGYKAFCNKIWNASKFIIMNLGDDFTPKKLDADKCEIFDKWILTVLHNAAADITRALQEYRFNEAAQLIYEFFWHELCDWYLELTKPRLYSKDTADESGNNAKQVLYHLLDQSIKLMHPFMPFITEEINSILNNGVSNKRVIVSEWPKPDEKFNFPKEAEEINVFKEIIYKIRNIRGEMNLAPDKKASVVFKTSDSSIEKIINREAVHIKNLAKVENITISADYMPGNTDASAVMKNLEIFIPLKGLIDIEAELNRLTKEMNRIDTDLAKIQAKLSNSQFVSNAPEEVVLKEKGKEKDLLEMKDLVAQNILKIKSI